MPPLAAKCVIEEDVLSLSPNYFNTKVLENRSLFHPFLRE